MKCVHSVMLGFLFLAPAVAVKAQTLAEQTLQQQGLLGPGSSDWNISLGGGVGSSPTYPGANSQRQRVVPLFSIAYHNEIFLGPLGLSWNALDWNGLRIGPAIGFSSGRKESDDSHLAGMGDISTSLAAGIFASYRFGSFDISAKVRQAVSHSENGLQALMQLDYRLWLVPHRLNLSLGPEVEFGTGAYNRTWFGVTPAQSATSGLDPFTPRGGLNAIGFNASLTYHLSDDWLLRAYGNIKSFQNDAANSPLVQSTTQRSFGIGIAYHF